MLAVWIVSLPWAPCSTVHLTERPKMRLLLNLLMYVIFCVDAIERSFKAMNLLVEKAFLQCDCDLVSAKPHLTAIILVCL